MLAIVSKLQTVPGGANGRSHAVFPLRPQAGNMSLSTAFTSRGMKILRKFVVITLFENVITNMQKTRIVSGNVSLFRCKRT
jgi:hypothetical protein